MAFLGKAGGRGDFEIGRRRVLPRHRGIGLAEITGEVGVSIRGLAAFTGGDRGVAHLLLVDQTVSLCREALERAGMGIADQREVLVANIEDRPGALGELTRRAWAQERCA